MLELLIVMVIMTVIFLIVLPKIAGVVRQGHEAQLHTHLHGLRNALATFHAHCGDWPAALADVVAPAGSHLIGASGRPIDPEDYHGPYFTATPTGTLPEDPMTGVADWAYLAVMGTVHSASPNQALDGTYYRDW
jgi:type II secretory pathway pseudopilin PulG